MKRCLYCYKPLDEKEGDFHKSCARKIFESAVPPELAYTRANLSELAREVISASTTIPGVQAKLSLDIDKGVKNSEPQRFTIVGLWGRYILKPQTERFANLPENEDLAMHLAEALGIKTVPHSLIRMKDGELAYITRRIDRTSWGGKIAMEDMCQLTERLTEDKYKGSYERIAKTIREFSDTPLLDIVNFWEVVLFSWIIGNADMHLKNFSLYAPEGQYQFSPAYDLLSTSIVLPEDEEELALTLNGKKKRLKREDFEKVMNESGMDRKSISKMFQKIKRTIPLWYEIIGNSFLPEEAKLAFISQIDNMSSRLF